MGSEIARMPSDDESSRPSRGRKRTSTANYCELSSGDEGKAQDSDEDAPLGSDGSADGSDSDEDAPLVRKPAPVKSAPPDDVKPKKSPAAKRKAPSSAPKKAPAVTPKTASPVASPTPKKTTPKKKLSFALGNGTIELTDSSASDDDEDDEEAAPMAVEEEPSSQPAVKQEAGALVEDTTAPPKKRAKQAGIASELPLVLAASALGKCGGAFLMQSGDKSIGLTGDTGAVGKIEVDKKDGIIIDLKGVKYQGTAYACSSLCVVNVGGSEAKIEVVLNSFLQLEHLNDTLQTETMLEGNLDGYDVEGGDDGGTKGSRGGDDEAPTTTGKGAKGKKASKSK